MENLKFTENVQTINLQEVYLSLFSTTIKDQLSSIIQKTQNIQKFYYLLLRPEVNIKDKVGESLLN